MIELLKTFSTQQACNEAFTRFAHDNPSFSVRPHVGLAELEGLRIHFRKVDSMSDAYQLAGYAFWGIDVQNATTGEWLLYLKARCRRPLPPKLPFRERVRILITGIYQK